MRSASVLRSGSALASASSWATASWATSEDAIAKAVADPKGSVKAVCAAAAEPLSEALDAELGALTLTLTLTLTLSQA